MKFTIEFASLDCKDNQYKPAAICKDGEPIRPLWGAIDAMQGDKPL